MRAYLLLVFKDASSKLVYFCILAHKAVHQSLMLLVLHHAVHDSLMGNDIHELWKWVKMGVASLT